MFILYHFRSFAILSWFEIISQPDLAGGSPSLVSWKVAKTALVTDQLNSIVNLSIATTEKHNVNTRVSKAYLNRLVI